MRKFATGTTVLAAETQGQIANLLMKYGCQRLINAMEPGVHVIYFEIESRGFKFALPLPDKDADEFIYHSRGKRSETQVIELYEKEVNRRWRAFGALIKATLVAVDEGILPLNQALAPYAMLPNRQTVAESVAENMKNLEGGLKALPWGNRE